MLVPAEQTGGFSPTRKLDWRWRLAEYLIHQEDDFVERLPVDGWTVAAAAVVAEDQGRMNTLFDIQGSEKKHLVRLAIELKNSGTLRPWAIEALLLVGDTAEEVARCVKIEPDVVEAYENVFFHVTDRLQATDWRQNQIWGDRLRVVKQFDDIHAGHCWLFWAINQTDTARMLVGEAVSRGLIDQPITSIEHMPDEFEAKRLVYEPTGAFIAAAVYPGNSERSMRLALASSLSRKRSSKSVEQTLELQPRQRSSKIRRNPKVG